MAAKKTKPIRRKKARAKRQYHVYVIELKKEAVSAPRRLERPLPRCVYVGQTAHTPEHRFEQHKAGGLLASRIVARYGVRLRPDLFPAENPVATRRTSEAPSSS